MVNAENAVGTGRSPLFCDGSIANALGPNKYSCIGLNNGNGNYRCWASSLELQGWRY